jgi:oxygen-dependent protoporphyrinogen oxidase
MPQLRVAVVGGGVSGLAAAHRLHQLQPDVEVRVFEASSRLGGPLATEHRNDMVLERGADSFLTREPWAVDLCRELGLGEELLPTSVENRRALVVCRGRLERVPDEFVLMQANNARAVLRSPVLSWLGKLRLLAEPFVRAPAQVADADYDESVASFATRRLGREAYERLVQPLLAGIYVADATKLSLAATMPEFLTAEREHGSLSAARRARAFSGANPSGAASPVPSPTRRAEAGGGGEGSGARYAAFVTLQRGMGSLIDALAAALPAGSVQLGSPVTELGASQGSQWRVATAGGGVETFDGVILAAPAARVASLVAPMDPTLGDALAQISSASSVVVTLVYAREQIARPLDGFGFVAPATEKRSILAASFPSVKFSSRGPADLAPVRVFFGGALHPELIERDDVELVSLAERELADLIGARGPFQESIVARWPASMPQYHVGHLTLVGAIERRVSAHRGLQVAGASYRGVGVPQCLRSGRSAAERLLGQLAAR